jgi:hypothetical protein
MSAVGLVVFEKPVEFNEHNSTTAINYKNAVLAKSSTEDKINFKYITYDHVTDETELKNMFCGTLKGYAKENYKDDSCLFTEFINTYEYAFNHLNQKQLLKFKLNYENLFSVVFPNEKYNKNKTLTASLNQFEPVFRKFRIRCIALNIKYQIVYKYDPVDEGLLINKNINPQCFYILVHNQHAYKLNHMIKSLEQQLKHLLVLFD